MVRQWGPLVLYEQEGVEGGGTLLTADQPATPEANAQQPNNSQGDTQHNADTTAKESLPGWVAGLEADLRTNPLITAHQKPTSFVKEALQWKAKADQAIVRPAEDATPEQVAAYRQAMGIPAKAEDYELDATGFSDEFVKTQRELYLQHGIGKDQAKALWEATKKQVEQGAETLRRANVQEKQQAEATLRTEYGDKFPQVVQSARQALARFATPELRTYLEQTGMGNNAHLIRMLAKISDSIGGDSLLKGVDGKRSEIPEAQRRFPNSPEMFK